MGGSRNASLGERTPERKIPVKQQIMYRLIYEANVAQRCRAVGGTELAKVSRISVGAEGKPQPRRQSWAKATGHTSVSGDITLKITVSRIAN